MADDMGYADLSGYGRKEYKTPNLDKLASQGLKFINAYAVALLCTPMRKQKLFPELFTGGYFNAINKKRCGTVTGNGCRMKKGNTSLIFQSIRLKKQFNKKRTGHC